MLLSFFLRKKFERHFESIVIDDLLKPLGMNETVFDPKLIDPSLCRIIPIERESSQFKKWMVQDESARLLAEPVGSAGLFSTMNDILLFGQSFLGDNTFLPKEVIKLMPVSQFENAAMTFGLGMGLRHQNECDLCNEDGTPIVVIKKNGFSGIHFCVFPENDFVFCVFGNICYPHRPSAEKRDQFTLFHKKLLRLTYQNRFDLL